ncbi:ATP-binding cassette domain-containing protein [Alkalilimnicola ehrlichii MLHE-1]|uniref:Amino acid ABC transporter ATP-binding protein, PAAT family n=1 Tax=Alkalilimnicola ehrlichii (strain ATCC BAA-1101 / DSM 17681 / MLHE-1) TaxID=187272 RepID=Q0A508_ALKEH|nr:ATP-binding cassette domain-containing protein [Alkalilimnicola ehrlichii]ABI58079.1 amino acid ABC transporter ATP-binding protein, PAAT family [Alkalilimnicola ehrlichii MLHE-1]
MLQPVSDAGPGPESAGRVESALLPLELKGIGFRHRGQPLLQGVDLRIGGRGKTIVMGPNGAGKSLLMRICHGLLTPTEGELVWRGPRGGRAEERRRRQAMVFQRPVMLRRSALANVTFALAAQGYRRRQRRERAMAALTRFGLAPLARRPARVLSGGEQQRLALARAWALEPEVLFLDEPTAALDPAATKAVEEAVAGFDRRGTRIVMTTHDLGQARRLADEVVFICGGRLLERTPVADFFERPRSPEARAFTRGELVW